MALGYFALGDRAAGRPPTTTCTTTTRFIGEYAGMIADSAANDAATVKQYVEGFSEAGCDEHVLFPGNPDPGQVDLLADVVGDALDPS